MNNMTMADRVKYKIKEPFKWRGGAMLAQHGGGGGGNVGIGTNAGKV